MAGTKRAKTPKRAKERLAPQRAAPPKVALLIETSNAFARGILAGIEQYIRNEGPWDVFMSEQGRGDRVPDWIHRFKGDGIIARIENDDIAKALRPLKIPIVDVSFFRLVPQVPTVTTDNEQIAELAFQHLAERGFRNFAFCGVSKFAWSRSRHENFEKLTRQHGAVCENFVENPDPKAAGDVETDAIAKWLQGLPKPVAVFSPYDLRGQQVLVACRRAGLSVPEEVAVLGVDNDELLCALSPPPLSSVIPDTRRAGYCASELLGRMMAGHPVDKQVRLIAPIGVAARQSTDTLAVDDVEIAGALRYIREHATEGLHVDDVLARFPMARRSLEKRMKKLIGRAPHEEIRRVQINRARELLSGSGLRLAEIAERCGFRYPEYLSATFKRELGVSPRQFRKQHVVSK